MCGQAATRFSGLTTESEPEEPQPELWLSGSRGEIFPGLEGTA